MIPDHPKYRFSKRYHKYEKQESKESTIGLILYAEASKMDGVVLGIVCTGSILVWSPPDSTGKQYIQAEIDLRLEENSHTGQHSQMTASDTTHVSAQVEHTGTS